jgi:hypothetical protein
VLHVISIGEAVLNYLLSFEEADHRLLRLYDFLTDGGDMSEVEILASHSIKACGYGRFLVEVSISIPSLELDEEEDIMILLDRKVILFSATAEAIVWMGESNPTDTSEHAKTCFSTENMWFDTMVFFYFLPGFLHLQSHISYFGIFFTTCLFFFTTRINFKIPWVRIPLPQVIYEVPTTEILGSHPHKYVDPYSVICFIYVVFIFVNVIISFFLPGSILSLPEYIRHKYGLPYLVPSIPTRYFIVSPLPTEQKYEHFLTVLPGRMLVILLHTIHNLSHFFIARSESGFL